MEGQDSFAASPGCNKRSLVAHIGNIGAWAKGRSRDRVDAIICRQKKEISRVKLVTMKPR